MKVAFRVISIFYSDINNVFINLVSSLGNIVLIFVISFILTSVSNIHSLLSLSYKKVA